MSPWDPPGMTRLMFGWPCEFDGVGGIFRAHVHLKLHVDQFLAGGKPARNLVDAGGLSRFDRKEFRLVRAPWRLWVRSFR